MANWKLDLIHALHDKKAHGGPDAVIAAAAKAAGVQDSAVWAWNELISGDHYGEPNVCVALWTHIVPKGSQLGLLEKWRDAAPHSTTRIQLSYCVMSRHTRPMTIAAMWYSTTHHRDKNLLLCGTLQRVQRNISNPGYDTAEDYQEVRTVLDWFTQETIVGGEEEQWGNSEQTYAALITKNQQGATQLLRRSEIES